MRADVKEKWVAALKSGNYSQGKSALARRDEEGNIEYCCLGVLCQLAVDEGIITSAFRAPETQSLLMYANETAYLPEEVVEWAGLDSRCPISNVEDGMGFKMGLADLNDEGRSFNEIAEIIKESDL